MCKRNGATAVFDALVVESFLQLISVPWVCVTRKVLHTLDLFDFNSDVSTDVTTCIKAKDVNCHAQIVFIRLHILVLIVMLPEWTWRGRLARLLGGSALHCLTVQCVCTSIVHICKRE